MKYCTLIIASILFISCKGDSNTTQKDEIKAPSPYEYESFSAYWDKGVAELNSYELLQYRYGEPRNGEAVLVFVTEDFSKQKQVKLDHPEKTEDKEHILKLNFTKKFITGIYPYSMMLSVFSPLDGSINPIKLTTTSQEWCGHTFTQLNKKQSRYDVKLYSYFESEGDTNYTIKDNMIVEDALWNRIRTNPSYLPLDTQYILPGTLYQRLSHTDLEPIKAICTIDTILNKNYEDVYGEYYAAYTIKYIESGRYLSIYYSINFPYYILGWDETYKGLDGKPNTTKAVLRKRLQLDYWNHHDNIDKFWRDSLDVKY